MKPHIDDKNTNQDEEIKKEDVNFYMFDVVSMYPTVLNNIILDSENEIKNQEGKIMYHEGKIMYHDTDSYNKNVS